MTRAYTVEVQTASVFYAQSLILLLFRSIDPLLSLVAVKHGHTISAVGVEPCTGGSTFQGVRGGGRGGGGGGRGGGRQAVENLAQRDNIQAILTNTSNTNQNNPQNTPAGRRITTYESRKINNLIEYRYKDRENSKKPEALEESFTMHTYTHLRLGGLTMAHPIG